VAQVATAVPAFIGYTQNGPVGAVKIAQVSSLLDYEAIFGKAAVTPFTPGTDGSLAAATSAPANLLWYAIDLYFRNGGGRCYIVSADNQSTALSSARLRAGLDAISREDEPTILVIPEAVKLDIDDYGDVCKAALAQCAKLGDRFAILDIKEDAVVTGKTAIEASRDQFGANNLSYGAAYYPSLNTTLTHLYSEDSVQIGGRSLTAIKAEGTTLYGTAKRGLDAQRVQLPASAAIAAVYTSVDSARGVWKAPANVSLTAVVGPTVQLSQEEQEDLNVVDNGKSINAIRAFAGRGILVWGARTLAGNDNEWRYVPVRRLFLTIEESARKASAFAVFEPNDATTWLKVKGMIEAYLYGLWEQGALQGSKAEQAYFVNVGLGKTMSSQDILEGRMIVEIGIAAVRPAEFILLRFSHKLAEA
ncbi:MAG TPA: phage tail sheath subtilisin-like domain-containing protein, partial [Myxococcota bacterium]|nr:phage tail sheath subtilisin-like domain-containing protein [Myxococcota bacterium]